MDLLLTFSGGRISGDGADDVGRFLVAGGYDASEGECYWTKTYIGAHDVFYRGFRERKGIWGTWELSAYTGGFHIWPLGEEGASECVFVEETVTTDAIATQLA